ATSAAGGHDNSDRSRLSSPRCRGAIAQLPPPASRVGWRWSRDRERSPPPPLDRSRLPAPPGSPTSTGHHRMRGPALPQRLPPSRAHIAQETGHLPKIALKAASVFSAWVVDVMRPPAPKVCPLVPLESACP